MIYPLLRKCLFQFKPETAHRISLTVLQLLYKLQLTRLFPQVSAPCNVMGLSFANPIGLAAGLDKNGDYIDALASLGFGFIEIGTVTPRPQPGNLPPRLFRLSEQQALINRLGFNNKGIDYVVERLKQTKYQGVLGVNIGKNKDTPLEKAVEDYVFAFQRVAPYASYVTLNISSPNTPQLRQLQESELLKVLLKTLKQAQANVFQIQNKYVPLVVKISPDVNAEELTTMATIFLEEKIDGVIATNTTLTRPSVDGLPYAGEEGGLSGPPLNHLSTKIIKQLHALLKENIPIIGCGGIASARDVIEKRQAGAKLIQVYTSLIYQGPGLIKHLYSTVTDFARFRG